MSRFEVELKKIIEQEIDRVRAELEGGKLASFEDYKAKCAELVTYKRVVSAYFDEANQKASKQ